MISRSGRKLFGERHGHREARKLFDIEVLNRIHAKMQHQLSEVGATVEAVFFCPHSARDHCECRKPKPGMINEIGERLRVRLCWEIAGPDVRSRQRVDEGR